MDSSPSYFYLSCPCGHGAAVALSRWLHRDELLRRARCTACGRRGALDVTFLSGPDPGKAWSALVREGMPVIEV